jgi:DNA-binding NtrC family response regulator
MRKRILVVDEFAGIMELLRTYRTLQCNMDIDTCSSAREALEKIALKTYDMIISDYNIREMDGIGLLKFIREMKYGIPFILLSRIYDPEIELVTKEYGALYKLRSEPPVYELENLLSQVEENPGTGARADIPVTAVINPA